MLLFPFVFPAGAKAFVCDQCGAQFSKEDALETHRQTHTGMLTFLFLLLNSFSKQTVQKEALCMLPPPWAAVLSRRAISQLCYFSPIEPLCPMEGSCVPPPPLISPHSVPKQ